MSDLKKTFENFKDKAEGEILENVGKVTGNEEMELKGKLKKKVVESKEAVSDLKNDVIRKMNDKIDASDASDEAKKLYHQQGIKSKELLQIQRNWICNRSFSNILTYFNCNRALCIV